MARFLLVAAATLLVGAAAETYPLFSWSGAKGTFSNYEPKSASELIAAKHHAFKASVVYLHSMSTEQLAGGGNPRPCRKPSAIQIRPSSALLTLRALTPMSWLLHTP